ncbi:MAG: endonuclease/exonuclease/phosphatase family protein, partial [Bifidobacterium mongoliense]|nr:endonuclease/exonuclease/phosphatase family protein [Bifidobacterium mongoliense]
AMARGRGRVLTFPSWLAWPRLELDHVLFTDGHGVVVDEISSFPVPGSDHLALTATLHMS